MIRQTATISIDIGHSNLKMVQTAPDGKILRFVVHKMPEGCVEDVNILSEDALIRSLKTARHTAHLSGGKCSLVLSGNDIIIRHFTLPVLSEEDLYQNIINEMSGYLPVDPEKYYVDYKITGTTQEDGIDMYQVLVTTAHRRIIGGYKKVLRSAGLGVGVVDTCENAIEKLLRFKFGPGGQFSSDEGICVIDFGTMHTRVHLYYNGRFFVSNVIKRAGQNITDAIAQTSGKDVITAETMKRENDFLSGSSKNADLGAAVTYEIDSQLFEITRVFDYFKNRTKKHIGAIYISGGGALLPGLEDYMGKHLKLPVCFASELISMPGNMDPKGFSFMLNAYAATFREDQR
jgi:Tfp pilus assembly protein, ATPase PilM